MSIEFFPSPLVPGRCADGPELSETWWGKALNPLVKLCRSLKFSTHPSNKWFRLPVVFPLDGSHSLFLWVKSPELIGSICSITIILGEMTSRVGEIHLFWGEVTLCRLLWTPGLRLWYSPPGRQAEDPLVPLGLTAHFGGLSKGLPHWRHFGMGFHKLRCWGVAFGCTLGSPWYLHMEISLDMDIWMQVGRRLGELVEHPLLGVANFDP